MRGYMTLRQYVALVGIVLLTALSSGCSPQEDGELSGTNSPPVRNLTDVDCSVGEDRVLNYSTTAEVSELMQCIRYGHVDKALALIEGGADLTYSTNIGTTAMSWAIQAGDTAVFQALRDRGVPPSAGSTPLLYYPVQQGDLGMVRLLLDAGANANEPGLGGQPPLSTAAGTGDTALVRLLLAHGADIGVDPRNEFAGGPPLVEATDRVMIDFLLDAGADINQPEWYHNQTLLWRVVCGRTEYWSASERLDLARHIIARGAQVDTRESDDGQTPLICAVRANNAGMVRLLVDNGGNVNARWAGATLVELGREAGDSIVVRLLRAAGAQ